MQPHRFVRLQHPASSLGQQKPVGPSTCPRGKMVVLNYLGLHGEEGRFGMVLDNPGLGTGAAVAPYIAFNPIV